MCGGGIFDFGKPCSKERLRAGEVIAGMMMERRGDLDDALKAAAFDASRFQPDFFPGFVRFKETPRIEMIAAARECFREDFIEKFGRDRTCARRRIRPWFSPRFGLGFQNPA